MTGAEAARAYVQQNMRIIPLHVAPRGRQSCSCGNVNCPNPGKHPRTPNGLDDASSDPVVIEQWNARYPGCNWGGIPGPDKVLIDVDGPQGEQAAAALGLLSEPTLIVQSGRPEGGHHRYYRHPGGVIGNQSLAPKLDVRADRGYGILPPSIHWSGRRYRWIGKISDLADLPPNVVERLRRSSVGQGPTLAPAAVIDEGERNRTLASIAGSLRRRGLDSHEIFACLLAVNSRRCRPALSGDEVYGIAESVGRYKPAAAPTALPPLARTSERSSRALVPEW